MPFPTINNLQIYHEKRGTGPRLLYISGTGGDLRKRPNVFDSPLATHFEILTYDRLPQLAMPVYVCGGRYDGVAPVDNLDALVRQIPNATLGLFEGRHGFLA